MSDSDANSSASKSTKGGLSGKPPDLVCTYFSTIPGDCLSEYVTLGQEAECQAFGDEPDAGNVDLAALLAETFS